jgi:predicted DNA-binding protein (MmcQ/YjbR family)
MPLTIDTIREYCLKKNGAITEEFPFGEDVLVFKVEGKMFLLTRIEQRPLSLNLKCDPERAIESRERYESVQPGYHMNKKYWNTVIVDDSIPSKEILKMIDHSYEQVVKGLPQKLSKRLMESES